MVISYLVMYYSDKVLGHLGGVCPAHMWLMAYHMVPNTE